jgi:hypothetical protein
MLAMFIPGFGSKGKIVNEWVTELEFFFSNYG